MPRIMPHLWFDTQAKEAAEFYVGAFGRGSRVTNVTTLRETPSGNCDVVAFELAGQAFMSISAGPLFTFNPSISFFVNFDPSGEADAAAELDALWAKLSVGGTALMPLDTYPFSDRFGWIQDRFGVSWQLILTRPGGEPRPFIVPSLMFTGAVFGQAEQAIELYTSMFTSSRRGVTVMYPDHAGELAGTVMFADFQIEGQWFAAMDSSHPHGFAFNEAISLIVSCDTQAEIDRYWQLSAVPGAEQCGWLKDRFGVSWQITPSRMGQWLSGDSARVQRVTEAFLKMKKFDIAELERVFAS